MWAGGGFRASRGGGGGRLQAPRGVGIVLWSREAFCGRAKLLPLSVFFAQRGARRGAVEAATQRWVSVRSGDGALSPWTPLRLHNRQQRAIAPIILA